MNEYCFSISNAIADEGVAHSLSQTLRNTIPVIACVGTDATIGDALGPIVGTMLTEKNYPCFIYGTLSSPMTAKEIIKLKEFINKAHPYSKVLVIDAAVGKFEDVGKIKINEDGIKPGLGANKDLPKLGDVSIIGIVAERSKYNQALLNFTRLRSIYRFAQIIVNGISKYLDELIENKI